MTIDRIEINPAVMLGKPVIRGTRIPVELILRKLSEGATEADLLDAYTGSALAGGATTGITLAAFSGATPGEVVTEARDAVGTAAEWVGDHSTSLKVVGGTLAGAVVAAAVGGYLARRAGQKPLVADDRASQGSGEPATQVRGDWLIRLQQWAAGQTRTLRPVSLDQSREPRSDDIA